MKKVLCVLLAVVMLLSMVACSKEEPKDTANAPVTSEDTQPQKETTEATEETQKEEYQKFQLPRMEMYCNTPIESGATTNKRVAVVTGYEAYIGTVFCGGTDEYSGELEGILAYASDDYVNDVAYFLYSDLDAETLKAVSSERTSVSGYDAVKFAESVRTTSDKYYEIYGYAMIIEDRPVVFMGILCSEDQAQADLEEMQELVDLMAGSIYK